MTDESDEEGLPRMKKAKEPEVELPNSQEYTPVFTDLDKVAIDVEAMLFKKAQPA